MKQLSLLFCLFACLSLQAQSCPDDPTTPYGWAENSVNTVIFRNNSVVSFGDMQFISYYDAEGYLCLGKRTKKDSAWQLQQTPYQGNKKDAHNCISIMVDGAGYLHVAWNHHNSPLNYTKSRDAQLGVSTPLDLEEPQSMTGNLEDKVTYPGFYKMTNGNLLFLYREGGSGNGNLVMNVYDIQTKKWSQIHNNLIDGESLRNAYWQACIDSKGTIHLSWVWRETPDVATNHDMCYARSADGGYTWTNSKGEEYALPITAATAEYACHIPQNSELINQTSMTTDREGNPYIATYYRLPDSQIPQYHIIYLDDKKQWQDVSLNFRETPFSLSGLGTKKIPVSRPQIICLDNDDQKQFALIYRDEERGSKVTLAVCSDFPRNQWLIKDLTSYPVGEWEPTYDTELWKEQQLLHLFVQKVQQGDGEKNTDIEAQPIVILPVPIDRWIQLLSATKMTND
ncbi:hypothetical protein FACS189437_05360 [Bacteroidia bacterium]|nr:hypothetical protein FACS189437_05360 [Bacteroidia bacterium]